MTNRVDDESKGFETGAEKAEFFKCEPFKIKNYE